MSGPRPSVGLGKRGARHSGLLPTQPNSSKTDAPALGPRTIRWLPLPNPSLGGRAGLLPHALVVCGSSIPSKTARSGAPYRAIRSWCLLSMHLGPRSAPVFLGAWVVLHRRPRPLGPQPARRHHVDGALAVLPCPRCARHHVGAPVPAGEQGEAEAQILARRRRPPAPGHRPARGPPHEQRRLARCPRPGLDTPAAADAPGPHARHADRPGPLRNTGGGGRRGPGREDLQPRREAEAPPRAVPGLGPRRAVHQLDPQPPGPPAGRRQGPGGRRLGDQRRRGHEAHPARIRGAHEQPRGGRLPEQRRARARGALEGREGARGHAVPAAPGQRRPVHHVDPAHPRGRHRELGPAVAREVGQRRHGPQLAAGLGPPQLGHHRRPARRIDREPPDRAGARAPPPVARHGHPGHPRRRHDLGAQGGVGPRPRLVPGPRRPAHQRHQRPHHRRHDARPPSSACPPLCHADLLPPPRIGASRARPQQHPCQGPRMNENGLIQGTLTDPSRSPGGDDGRPGPGTRPALLPVPAAALVG